MVHVLAVIHFFLLKTDGITWVNSEISKLISDSKTSMSEHLVVLEVGVCCNWGDSM